MSFFKKLAASVGIKTQAPLSDDGMYPQPEVWVPQSGMERAEWFSRATPRSTTDFLGYCTGGKATIGAIERGPMGTTRDSAYGSVMVVRHNYAEFPDPSFGISADAGTIWNTQVQSSRGLYDGDREIYVNQDTQTVWG